MGQILWNTDVNAPCCPGEIVDVETGRSLLIQPDWDFPGVARTFGWNRGDVQNCPRCKMPVHQFSGGVAWCEVCASEFSPCPHTHTDGTVDCPDCGVSAGQFIQAAREYLEGVDGMVVDDPGYFMND